MNDYVTFPHVNLVFAVQRTVKDLKGKEAHIYGYLPTTTIGYGTPFVDCAFVDRSSKSSSGFADYFLSIGVHLEFSRTERNFERSGRIIFIFEMAKAKSDNNHEER